jgi:hypothetical protein
LPRFSFAEASVNIAEAFPYFTACTTTAYVQVRTRSSSTATSDLKDTTKVFEYQFSGPKAASALSGGCAQSFFYTSAGSKDSLGGTSLTYNWKFKAPAGVTLSGTGITGPDANGFYSSTQASGVVNVGLPAGVNSASITSQLIVSQSGCSSTSHVATTQTITVLRALTAAITSKVPDGTTMSVSLTGNAPTATSVQWQRLVNNVWTDIPGATAATFNYSSFEADSTPTATGFTLGGSAYDGKLWQVSLRLRAQRIANGTTCAAVSAPVVLKKITAVDP